MPDYSVKIKSRELVAENTQAFHFNKPDGFTFRPGQYLDMTLIDPPESDAEGNIRSFSIASPPYENRLTIVTRLRDTAFKRVLKSMPIGTDIKIAGPMGSFTLHQNAEKPAVLLAGGIGITPFRSILLQAAQDKLPHRLFLFYSNRRPEDAPFLRELADLEKLNPNYKFVGTMTEIAKSRLPWKGETGYITNKMVLKYFGNLSGPIYYIAGPPGLVSGLRQILNQAGVSDDDIRSEEFSGY